MDTEDFPPPPPESKVNTPLPFTCNMRISFRTEKTCCETWWDGAVAKTAWLSCVGFITPRSEVWSLYGLNVSNITLTDEQRSLYKQDGNKMLLPNMTCT